MVTRNETRCDGARCEGAITDEQKLHGRTTEWCARSDALRRNQKKMRGTSVAYAPDVMIRPSLSRLAAAIVCAMLALTIVTAAATLNGALPGPLPLFPRSNWWNSDISQAPIDPASASFISFIGTTRQLHPDFGGEASPGSVAIYGFPYVVVDGTQAKKAVEFQVPPTRATA